MRVKQITSGYEHIELCFEGPEENHTVRLITEDGDHRRPERRRVNVWSWQEALRIRDAINEEARIHLRKAGSY